MITFADSSALVKLYADEPGAELVRGFPFFVVSALARVEVPSAIWRKRRRDQLSAEHAAALIAGFEGDYSGVAVSGTRFAPIAISAVLLDQAARFTAVHQLRGFDATQLASAVSARAADPECNGFAAYDLSLRTAAAAEGFRLIPEQAG